MPWKLGHPCVSTAHFNTVSGFLNCREDTLYTYVATGFIVGDLEWTDDIPLVCYVVLYPECNNKVTRLTNKQRIY